MSRTKALIVSMRPKQWTKNLLVFAPLIFSGELILAPALVDAALTFVAMCLVSGAVYLFNDVLDLERDRMHGKKCRRPIAHGDVPVPVALATGGVVLVAGMALATFVDARVAAVLLGYIVLQAAYVLKLKHEVLLDVFSIAAGFLLRAGAGAFAVNTEMSPWLYSSVSLLALFLALGKRRHELLSLDTEAVAHRPVLAQYSPQLLDALLASVTAATIVTYAMYSFSSETARQATGLLFTVPFVAYGIFRYLYLIYKRNLGGNPEEMLLTDVPLILAIAAWLAAAVYSLYVL